MKCYLCAVQTPLFRVNEKGAKGIWACKIHMNKPIEPLVEEIVDIIQGDK